MYPFITSYSDLPIFFSKPSIEIELEGSKGLRYRVPQSVSSVRLGWVSSSETTTQSRVCD